MLSRLAVHTFHPATPGDRGMAVDAMTTTPVRATTLTPPKPGTPTYAPAWVSKALDDLALGDVLEVEAEVSFAYDGDGRGCAGCGAGGKDACPPSAHPNDPNIQALVLLTQNPALEGNPLDDQNPGHACYEDGACTVVISADVNTNLTPSLPALTHALGARRFPRATRARLRGPLLHHRVPDVERSAREAVVPGRRGRPDRRRELRRAHGPRGRCPARPGAAPSEARRQRP
jgi:hypothetical protein